MSYVNPNQSGFYTKPLTKMELFNFGIPVDNLKSVENLESLKLTPPNIVIASCVDSVKFLQNQSREQQLKKKNKYVMGLGTYMQLHYDMVQQREILKPSSFKFKNVYKPYNGEDLSNKSILVFRTGGIGDLLFISPNLRFLKEKYPTCIIRFACGPQYHSMIKEWEFIDEVLDLPFEVTKLFTSDYHAFFEGVIERCKEAESVNAYKLFSRWLNLNLEDKLLVPKQKPNKEKLENCKEIISKFGVKEKDFIIVQIRSSSPIRTPSHDIWIKIINSLTSKGHNIIITDSHHSSSLIDRFITKLENKEKVFNFSLYSKEIGDNIAMTSLAKLALGIDSSLNHIAISVGTKTFGIFGPFPANVRLTTYPKNMYDSIECTKECAPCFIHGQQLCKYGQYGYVPCYDTLNVNEIIEKIERLLNNV